MAELTILNGDCLEVLKTLPDKSVDLFICDLPFGCISTEWDNKLNLVKLWEQIKRLAKNDNTPVLHFTTTKYGIELINSNPSWFRYDLVWNKDRGTSFLTANKMPLRAHEMIYVFSRAGAFYIRKDDKGEFKGWKGHAAPSKCRTVKEGSGQNVATPNDGTTRCVKSVITLKKPNTLGHPTEKPVELYKWLIERYCPVGGTVLDPTAGSFNSCFAAYELDRSAIGIEKDPVFYQRAVARMELLENLPVPEQDGSNGTPHVRME